jgi:uncharacterized membrane protein YgdD (TMEM256/DUF423 family)
MQSRNLFIVLGAVNGFLAVALGAFAAHGLEAILAPRLLEVFRTGVDYQAIHALALLAVGILGAQVRGHPGALRFAGWAFLVGILLFSGSLYLMALTGTRWLGAVTPFGGTAFLAGWAALAWHGRAHAAR